jgi:hypothetical protein
MAYRPADHVLTGRQILAAWLVCLGVAVTGFGLPVLWHEAQSVAHHQQASRLATLPHHA